MTYKTTKEKDIELWKAYKASPTPLNLRALMKQIDPAIQNEVNKWMGASVSRSVLQGTAQKLALEAIKTYDPTRGSALVTHVVNRLQKLSRVVYTHQDAVRIPEHKKLKTHALHRATEELMAEHGREPTNAELQRHLVWSPRMLSQVQEAQAPELLESQDMGAGLFEHTSIWAPDNNDGIIDMMYYDMSPEDKLLLEHTTGYSGKTILSNTDMAAKLKITQGQLSYKKKLLKQRIQEQTS